MDGENEYQDYRPFTQQLEGDTHVPVVVKIIVHHHAEVLALQHEYQEENNTEDPSLSTFGSYFANLERTLISSLAASLYFLTFLIILMARVLDFCVSSHFTTFPNVPSPNSVTILYL